MSGWGSLFVTVSFGSFLKDLFQSFSKMGFSLCFRYGHFSGINRKLQLKSLNDKRNIDMKKKFKGRNKDSDPPHDDSNNPTLLLILKWGGELTPMGKKQAEELGRAFRCMYPGGQGMILFLIFLSNLYKTCFYLKK